MAKKTEANGDLKQRVAQLESFQQSHTRLLYALAGVFSLWLGTISVWFFGFKGDLQAIKQNLHDNGLGGIVAQLKDAPSTTVADAQLTVLNGELRLQKVHGKPLNESQLSVLVPTVKAASKRYPELASAWEATATLVSLKSASVGPTVRLPNCNVNIHWRTIDPREVPGVHLPAQLMNGYVFRDCVLHMNDLPPATVRTQATSPPIEKDGIIPAGTPIQQVFTVIAIDCDVVLDDSGIVGRLFFFAASDCRFDFSLHEVPDTPTQRFLLASLDNPLPGMIELKEPL